MAVLNIPVVKGKSAIEVDTDLLNDDVMQEIVTQGLKVLLNRGTSKITKETYPDAEALKSAALAKAAEQLEMLKEGKVKKSKAVGGKVPAVVMTEARRIARNMVKDDIKRNGGKISHYPASEITKAANALIDADKSIIEMAQQAITAREAAPLAIKVSELIHESPELVAKAEQRKAEAKANAPLSAKQAGKVAPRKRAAAQATA